MPEMVTEFSAERKSSSGEVIVSCGPFVVGWEVGAGVTSGEVIVGVGLAPFLGRFFRLLLAVQIPKVIMSPNTKPMMMAAKNSFFMAID